MTLILSVLTGNRVIQASDRRLTYPYGTIKDNEANKAICVVCADAIFSIGYAGLAEIDDLRTDEWITNYLTQMEIGELKFNNLVDNLKTELKNTIDTLPYSNDNKRISLDIVGFYNNSPFFGHISNYKDKNFPNVKINDNELYFVVLSKIMNIPDKKLFCYYLNGCFPEVEKTLSTRLNRLKRKRFFHKAENDLVVNEVVSLIRAAALHPKSKNKIGRSCMSVVIEKDSMIFHTRYHPEKSSPQLYAPHLITPETSFKNIEIWMGEGPPYWWAD